MEEKRVNGPTAHVSQSSRPYAWDDVADGGGEIITKDRKPICRLVPYREAAASFFGSDKGKIKIFGDIVSPMPAHWFEDRDDDVSSPLLNAHCESQDSLSRIVP